MNFTESLLLTFQLAAGSWWVYLIFGLLFGSFLNVVINRIPAGQSIVSPPSACPNCHAQIKWFDNIPVLSWLILRAKCRNCHTPISWQYPLVEAVAGTMATLLFLSVGVTPKLLIILPLSYILLAIAVIDWKTYSIPAKMQYSLLTVALLAIGLNLIYPQTLNISLFNSILGGFAGYGVLWIIQIVGRMIYKQEAMGGGDLWLLAFGGLIIGPFGVFWAFVLGSMLAVIAYMVPAVLKMIAKKREVAELEKNAVALSHFSAENPDDDIALNLLKMQIDFNCKNSEIDAIKQNNIELLTVMNSNHSALTGFFRFLAVEDEKRAVSALKLYQPSQDESAEIQILKEILNSDLLGYGTFEDNFKLLKKYAEQEKLSGLLKLLEVKKPLEPESKIPDLQAVLQKLEDYKEDKLDYLLTVNRLYQYCGYTAEQLVIATKIKELLPTLSLQQQNTAFAELSFVYYTDLYYKEYGDELKNLQANCKKSGDISNTAILKLFNLVLYRQYFFKQKLAFGPYLAMGILLAFLYGSQISGWYLSLIEQMIK